LVRLIIDEIGHNPNVLVAKLRERTNWRPIYDYRARQGADARNFPGTLKQTQCTVGIASIRDEEWIVESVNNANAAACDPPLQDLRTHKSGLSMHEHGVAPRQIV
jgi:hypothetical protein